MPAERSRRFDILLALLVSTFALGWGYGIASALSTGRPGPEARLLTANPLSSSSPPEAAFVLDALVRATSDVEELRGESGALRVVVVEPGQPLPVPDSLPEGVEVRVEPELPARGGTGQGGDERGGATAPGISTLLLGMRNLVRSVPDLRVLTLVPISAKQGGRIGAYQIGDWPFEKGGTPPSEAYLTPGGLAEVTPENAGLPVSEHFTLGDFLTKGQEDVWPKYVALSTRLLDKLELTIQQLEASGHAVADVGVISGFRTPWYNAHGGDPQGRGGLSRHMYGDAMDFYIDNDGDGRMDDLTGDGKVDVEDARLLAGVADEVERAHPGLVGGIGVYRPTGAHAGFVHLDTRGYRARW